jgi:hypothetical protein
MWLTPLPTLQDGQADHVEQLRRQLAYTPRCTRRAIARTAAARAAHAARRCRGTGQVGQRHHGRFPPAQLPNMYRLSKAAQRCAGKILPASPAGSVESAQMRWRITVAFRMDAE